MEFNKNWLNLFRVIKCLIQCRQERKRQEKEIRDYELKKKQGSKHK